MSTQITRSQQHRRTFVALGVVAIAAAAGATAAPAGWVKDASRAPFPNQPARGMIAGKPFLVKAAQLARSGSMTMGDAKMDTYSLDLRTNDSIFPDAEASVVFLVKQGQKPDGKTFVRLPHPPHKFGGDLSAQFAAFKPVELVPGMPPGTRVPLIQGLNMSAKGEDTDEKLSDSDDGAAPTLRLQFGKRAGNVLPGKIYFCWNDAKKSHVAGTFEARVKLIPVLSSGGAW
jgi:hypothetical protein